MAIIELVFAVVGAWTMLSLLLAGFILARRSANHRRHPAAMLSQLPSRQQGAV